MFICLFICLFNRINLFVYLVQGKRIHTPEVEITGEDSIDQKMTSQLSSCFLFPEYSSSSKITALRDHLVLVKELSKAFDEGMEHLL